VTKGDAMVHIVKDNHPLCGFTGDHPRFWNLDQRWVWPEEAHYATCRHCISLLHEQDEYECTVLLNG
jgi:hypothetical protein